MGENGLATQQEVEDYMEKMDFSGDPNIIIDQEPSIDPWLNVQFLDGIWQGKIKYIKLNKKQNQIPTQTGYFELNGRTISLSDSPALSEVGEKKIKANIFDLFFMCLTTGPCHPDSYVQAYKKNNNIYDAIAIDKQIKSFLQDTQQKESSCFVLEFEHETFHYIRSYLGCTEDPVQGPILKTMVTNAFNQGYLHIDIETDPDVEKIPEISIKDKFEVTIYDDASGATTDKSIIMTDKLMRRADTDAILIKYKEIDNCKIHRDISEFPEITPDLIGPYAVAECCFLVGRFNRHFVICTKEPFRCLRSKNMIMKAMYQGCISKVMVMSYMEKIKNLELEDEFIFQYKRQGLLLPKNYDRMILHADMILDKDNANWEGWVFAQEITDRKFISPLYVYFCEITFQIVQLRKSMEGGVQINFQTDYLNSVCLETPQPCKPTEYLKAYRSKNDYNAQFELKETILAILSNLPVVDENGCMIIEQQEPNTRSTRSLMICTLYPNDGQGMRESVASAQYAASISSSILTEIPLAIYESEKFLVKIFEENKMQDDVIKFDEIGMVRDVKPAPDKFGNQCGFWYKRLRLPDAFEDTDANCCFYFTIKSGNAIIICSTQRFRCSRPAKTILKKLLYGCITTNKDKVPNPYASSNSDASEGEIDLYNTFLFDNSDSGVWKGLGWFHEIGKPDELSNVPIYIAIEYGYISFYHDPPAVGDIETRTPFRKLIHRNMRFPCSSSVYTCTPIDYLNYYKEQVSSNPLLSEQLKSEFKIVTQKLPAPNNKEMCCTVFPVINVLQIEETYIICTRVEKQGDNIKKALTMGFGNLIKHADIMKEIPIAHSKDSFKIMTYDQKLDLVKRETITFGRYFMFEKKSGQKLFKYNEIQPDKYGQKCAIWFSQIKLPKQLNAMASLQDCCFMFAVNSQTTYICSDESYHCQLPARQLIRTLKEGCMSDQKGLNLDGTDQPTYVPEQKNPKSEIYGEDSQLTKDISFDPGNPYFFKHTGEDVKSSPEDGQFESWVLETILPNEKREIIDPREVKVVITPSQIKVYSETNNVLEDINPSSMVWNCDTKENLCSPPELIEYYRKQGDQVNVDLKLIEVNWGKTKAIVGSSIQRCVALEFYTTIVSQVTQKRVFCLIPDNADLILSFNRALNTAFKTSFDFLTYDDIRASSIISSYKVEYIPPGSAVSKNIEITLGDQGIETAHTMFFKYIDVDDCNFCYGVQDDVINSIHTDTDCCIEFQVKGQYGYLCEQSQFRCAVKSRQLTRFMFEKCIAINKLAPINKPGYCLIVHVDHLPLDPNLLQDAMSHSELQNALMSTKTNEVVNATRFAEINAKDVSFNTYVQSEISQQLINLNNYLEYAQTPRQSVSNEIIDGKLYNYNQDSSVTIDDDQQGLKIISDVINNKTIIIDRNESISIQLDDGSQYIQRASGECEIDLPNGENISVSKDGKFLFQKDDINVEIIEDGTSIIHRKNQLTTVNKDKSAISELQDGTKILRFKDGFTQVEHFNSSTIVQSPSINLQN